MSVAQQQFGRFNLYDIFSNFLPGATFLLALLVPYTGVESLFIELKLGSILIWAIISFVTGLILQSIGGIVMHGNREFESRIHQVVTPGKNDEEVTEVEVNFVETVRNKFGLGPKFDNWTKVYKLVLAELDQGSTSRTLRLQALYLAMRGFSVGFFLLFPIYWTMFALGTIGMISTEIPTWGYVPLSIFAYLMSAISFLRAKEFNEDVADYMVLEFSLSNPPEQ